MWTLGLSIGGFALVVFVAYKIYTAGKETGRQEDEIQRFIDQQGTIDNINEFNRLLDEKEAEDRRRISGDDDSQPWVRREDRDG